MKYFFTLFVVLTFLITPVSAQEAVKPIKEADPKELLSLSKQMHEIWPIRQKVENALDTIAERLPEQDRTKFKGALRRSIDFEALEAASIDAMADIFSEKELKKMIDFYGSKEGRSVSHKTGDYEKALQPLMIKMMDKAFLNAKMGTPKPGGQSVPK